MRQLAAILIGLIALAAAGPAWAEGQTRWRILKDHWDAADEAGFGRFVQGFADHTCATPTLCFASSANPYRASDPPGFEIDGDCADFIYQMRGYYAWKNGLPFTFGLHAMARRDPYTEDRRFTLAGNMIVARPRPGWHSAAEPAEIFAALRDTVSTAMFRVAPTLVHQVTLSDFYSPRIDRTGIRPGTAVYDINGHVVFVARLTPAGEVLTVDSNPDRSVTREKFGPHFPRDDPKTGVLFQNFRPVRLIGSRKAADGSLIGGRTVLATNAEIAEFSLEQAFGTEANPSGDWRKARFVVAGEDLRFYDFVKRRLADPAALAAQEPR